MRDGLVDDYRSLQDYHDVECNIIAETWLWNVAREGHDDLLDEIRADLHNLRKENLPHWPAELPPVLPIPDIPYRRPPTRDNEPRLSDDDDDLDIRAAMHIDFSPEEDLLQDHDSLIANTDPVLPSPPGSSSSSSSSSLSSPEVASLSIHGKPPRKNMANSTNCCYMVAPIQLMHNQLLLRNQFKDSSNFPLIISTNRLQPRNDPTLSKHGELIKFLSELFADLDHGGSRLPENRTRGLFDCLHALEHEFSHEMNDPSRVTDVVLEALINAADASEKDDHMRLLSRQISEHEDNKIKQGLPITRIQEDAEAQWNAIKCHGNESLLFDLITSQIASESRCPNGDCASPISRGWEFASTVTLKLPPAHRPEKISTLKELFDLWANVVLDEGVTCACNKTHPKRFRSIKGFTRVPPVMFVRLDRSHARVLATGNQTGEEYEHVEKMILTPIQLEEEFDFAPWCIERTTSDISTTFVLTGVIRYLHQSKHYITFVKMLDGQKRRWTMLDSLNQAPPEWDQTPVAPQELNVCTSSFLVSQCC